MKQILTIIILSLATTVAAQQITTTPDTVITESEALEEPILEPAANSACPFLDTEKGQYYLDGNPISNKEVEEFLRLNDPEAWQSYKVGNPMWISGWCVLGAGAVLSTVGMGYLVCGIGYTTGSIFAILLTAGQYEPDSEMINHLMVTGGALSIAGGVLTATSIPLIVVGGIKKFSAHNIYNDNCQKQHPQPQLELTLQASSNGLGLALRF